MIGSCMHANKKKKNANHRLACNTEYNVAFICPRGYSSTALHNNINLTYKSVNAK